MKQVEIRRIQIDLCAQVIGAVLFLALGQMLGDQGAAYLAIAVNAFWLVWSLAGGYTADTLGRMLRARNSRGQYRSAERLKHTVLKLEAGLGLLGGAALALFAAVFSERLFGVPYLRPLLLALAPLVFLRSISAVLLGCLKGEGTELPTVVVAAARQILTAVFALLLGTLLRSYGEKVSRLLGVDAFAAMYGGLGVTLGLLLAETLCVVFLWLVYRASRAGAKQDRPESQRMSEGAPRQLQAYFAAAWPLLAKGVLIVLPLWIGIALLAGTLADAGNFAEQYGVFISQYAMLCCVVFLPLAAMLTENVKNAAQSLRREERLLAQRYFLEGMHGALIQGVFCAVFMAVTASQLADWLCPGSEDEVARLLRAGAFVIPLALLGYLITRILFASGGRLAALGGLLAADAVYAVAAWILLETTGAGAEALAYAGLIAGALYVVGMGFWLLRRLGGRMDWVRILVLPTVCACLIGLAVLFVARAASPHLGSSATVLLTLLLSYVLYWGALLLLRNLREIDIPYFPGGKLLGRIGRLLRAF